VFVPVAKQTPMSVVLRNRYDALLIEEIEEEQRVEEHYKQFPVLINKGKIVEVDDDYNENKNVFSSKPSYSAILKTVVAAPALPAMTTPKPLSDDSSKPIVTNLSDYIKMNGQIKVRMMKSWADDSDSESDEDDYFEK